MSAILGILGSTDSAPVEPFVPQRMLASMARRGDEHEATFTDVNATLGVARYGWELGAGFCGPVLVVQDGELAIAADATLYYRDDLRRKLAARGVRPSGQTSSHLILAAYHAWGERCAEELEGDFAFVLWDRRLRRLVAARDFGGRRPLHFARTSDGSLVFASTIGGVLAHPGCSTELDWEEIAVDAASLVFAASDQTCYRAIRRLHGGGTVVANADGHFRRLTHWEPQVGDSATHDPDAAADELRELLMDAVAERLDTRGRSTLLLSGGWDSPAVYAAAQQLAHEGRLGSRASLQSVSFRLPEDDVRCETRRIGLILDRWKAQTSWLDTDSVPMVGDPWEEWRAREEPWAHCYEQLVRALLGRASDGAHVVLDGFGGDSIFLNSRLVLAELFATGQWGALWNQWRRLPARSGSIALRYIMRPLIPPVAMRAWQAASGGRAATAPMERPVPFWMARGSMGRRLRERGMSGAPTYNGRYPAMGEIFWQLRSTSFQRVAAEHDGFGLEVGVQSRAPLMDNRVIRFALTRPWHERFDAGEGKHLLRRAMRDLLPAEILAGRPPGPKSGSLGGYLNAWKPLLASAYASGSRQSPLADMGIVDADALRRTVAQFARAPEQYPMPLELVATLSVDMWLLTRSHSGAPVGAMTSGRQLPETASRM